MVLHSSSLSFVTKKTGFERHISHSLTGKPTRRLPTSRKSLKGWGARGEGKLSGESFPLPLSKPLPSSSNIFVFIESLPPSFPVYGGAFAPTGLNMSSSPCPRRVPGGTGFLCCSSLPKKFSITNALILLSTFPVCLLDPFLSSTTAAFMNQTF